MSQDEQRGVIVIDKLTGTSLLWTHVPASVRRVVDQTRENWAKTNESDPPTTFIVKSEGSGVNKVYTVTYETPPKHKRNLFVRIWRRLFG